MDVQKFREVLKKLDETEIEYDYGIETVSYTHLTLPTICSV